MMSSIATAGFLSGHGGFSSMGVSAQKSARYVSSGTSEQKPLAICFGWAHSRSLCQVTAYCQYLDMFDG